LTERPHSHQTWMVRLYSPGCASVHRVLRSTGVHIAISPAIFAQLTAPSPYTLQWAAPFPLRIAISHGVSGPSSNTWFLGPTRVHNPYGILIGAAVLTDPTDHATRSVTIGRIYVCTTAMQPKNLIIINCLAGFGYEKFWSVPRGCTGSKQL